MVEFYGQASNRAASSASFRKSKFLSTFFAWATTPIAVLLLSGCGTPPDNCILGSWRGTYVTEAVNVQLDVTVTGIGVADSGNWSFTGADNVALGSGDLQAWQTGPVVDADVAYDRSVVP